MGKPIIIQEIVRRYTCSDYLSSLGHNPVVSNGDKLKYHCPNPSHDDSTPSFYIKEWNGIQYFRCYGCQVSGDIIDLVKLMEGVSFKDVLLKLGHGINVSSDREILNYAEEVSKLDDKSKSAILEDMAFRINRSCYEYLSIVNFDVAEVAFVDSVCEKIDPAIRAEDIETLREIYSILLKGFHLRYRKYLDRQEERLKERTLTV